MTAPGSPEPGDIEAAARPAPRTLRSDVLLMVTNKGLVILVTLISTVIVARSLGPAGRGTYALAVSFVLLAIQFGSLGLQAANPYMAAREPASLPQVVANSIWLMVVWGLALSGLGLIVDLVFPSLLRGLTTTDLVLVLIAIPLALGSVLFQSILLGEGRTVPYNVVESISAFGSVAALAVALLLLDLGVAAAISIVVVTYFATTATFLVLLVRHDPPVFKPNLALLRSMMTFAFRVYVAASLAYAIGRGNIFFVNSFLGGAEAGQYSVAFALAEGMILFPTVVALNLFPRIARGHGHEDSAFVFRAVALIHGLLCLISAALASIVIKVLYGAVYADAAGLYYWMVPGIFCLGMLSILSQHFTGKGFPLEAMLVWIPGAVLNFAVILIFLPGHGAYVAALASSAAYVLLLLLHMRLFARESGGYRALVPRPSEVRQVGSALLRDFRPGGSGG